MPHGVRGAINFRNIPGTNIYALGQPTLEAIDEVVRRVHEAHQRLDGRRSRRMFEERTDQCAFCSHLRRRNESLQQSPPLLDYDIEKL